MGSPAVSMIGQQKADVRGAVDFFLKLDGIDGESTDSKHKGEIDVLDWQIEATQAGTVQYGGGAGVGKVKLDDFHFIMPHSKASPKLFAACCSGEHIKKAVLIARKAGKQQQEFLKVTMSDLIVSRVAMGAKGFEGGALPTDAIDLCFSKIEVEYKEQKADGSLGGSVKVFHNVQENVTG